ncbi:unnamed protein product [Pseudo-nitzschia multistriata]|uniref:Uncharacterized protein n=1 Tax=Pseudo-nitzschia multistriata TaxID=183589 RepID=A0A448ZQ70_9STRA|nr:unnamed protein product [Pseudo-nitzschia multistriata]
MIAAAAPVGGSARAGMAFVAFLWLALFVSTCQSFLPQMQTNQKYPFRYANEETTEVGEPSSSSIGSPLSSWFPEDRQILRFREPTTNVTVLLIGSMHYNPASINLVETTVEKLGEQGELASVIIESCDIRWNKTQEMLQKKEEKQRQRLEATNRWKQSLGWPLEDDDSEGNDGAETSRVTQLQPLSNDKDFLGNEMRAAWEVASKYQRPTVLGDQRINATVDALKASLKETASDLLLGGPGGWKRSFDEIGANWNETIPMAPLSLSSSQETDVALREGDDDYLSAVAFFDPRLLISLPVSLVKYPLSFLVKDPIPVGTFFALLAALNLYGSGSLDLDPGSADGLSSTLLAAASAVLSAGTADATWKDYVLSVGIAVLETVLFARLLLKPLLADRNEILARSVLDQCALYATNGKAAGNSNNWLSRLISSPPTFGEQALGEREPEVGIVYVPGTDPETLMNGDYDSPEPGDKEKVVVAVLGMAHCNGVMKLLKEQRV